jgi:hypothetical protein
MRRLDLKQLDELLKQNSGRLPDEEIQFFGRVNVSRVAPGVGPTFLRYKGQLSIEPTGSTADKYVLFLGQAHNEGTVDFYFKQTEKPARVDFKDSSHPDTYAYDAAASALVIPIDMVPEAIISIDMIGNIKI